MRRRHTTVHPDGGLEVAGTDVKQQTSVAEVARDIDQSPIPDSGASKENGTRIRRGKLRPRSHPSRRPRSSSSKANSHSPFRFSQRGRTICGRGCSGRGIVVGIRARYHGVVGWPQPRPRRPLGVGALPANSFFRARRGNWRAKPGLGQAKRLLDSGCLRQRATKRWVQHRYAATFRPAYGIATMLMPQVCGAPPRLWLRATVAFFTWRGPALPCSCL
jgi:hypothetical protein